MKIIVKTIKIVFCLILLAVIIMAGVLTAQGYGMYRDAVGDTSIADKVQQIKAQANYTGIDELPGIYIDAVVSVEDHRFYEHPGIDVIAIGRAVINDIRAGAYVEGGSTITQQLAKNMYFTQEKLLVRKVAEVFMAFDIEKNYGKDEILELYVNSIYYGAGYYTVHAAAMGYFGKEPSRLTDAECTLLAGIPNAPSVYDLTQNPELALERRDAVLASMVRHGCLTDDEARDIAAPSF
ncbi:MAG: transglycosylase domain-containing protein [Oscillospiraceae bacterium]|nr:transglycosylase domain-containing protein [Oscillospiraceae bacterium]